MAEFLANLSRKTSIAALYASAIGLVGMTIIIGWQVFARYILNSSPAWTEQAALFLMLWFILFAAAAGVREGFHIRLSLLQESLTETAGRRLLYISHMVVLLFGVAMTKGGVDLAVNTWQHEIPTLGLPRGTAYLPIIGAGALIATFALEHIVALRRNRTVEPIWR
ncbi:TRAP transporter small permease [Parasphingorhabdus litoris]|uniref:TRAP transporter small permease protein n=1 Tax=Parasphingorhabdus litoris TaxID=394733 RepID=A0ABN1ATQ0_9SPHN|nr:TRAP transporter small permease [Parasphingorhabdus litoris]